MALENSRRKAPPPRPKEDPEKESLLDRRKMVSFVRKWELLLNVLVVLYLNHLLDPGGFFFKHGKPITHTLHAFDYKRHVKLKYIKFFQNINLPPQVDVLYLQAKHIRTFRTPR